MKIVRLLQQLINSFRKPKCDGAHCATCVYPEDLILVLDEDEEQTDEDRKKKASISDEVMQFVSKNYDVRYNTQTRTPEIKRKDADEDFKPVTKLERNTMVIDLHQAGCMAWNADVDRVLESLYMKLYNPLASYLNDLPAWDGVDRVSELAARVSKDELWVMVFHRWMRMMVASWKRAADKSPEASKQGNYMIPLLVSEEQGLRKSTFCRMLLPEELQTLYTDKFELDGSERLEEALAHYALVNLDEFDRYSIRHTAKLKNLVQLGRMSTRRAYSKTFSLMERTASFIGTSNRTDLLTDPTGSRRFFCINVAHAIDCDSPIDYAQLYAQLLHEVNEGLPTFFTHEEEERIQKHNEAFYRMSPLRECFLKTFAPAEVVDTDNAKDAKSTDATKNAEGAEGQSEWLTTTALFSIIRPDMRGMASKASPIALGRELQQMRYPHRHTSRGTVYKVKRLN